MRLCVAYRRILAAAAAAALLPGCGRKAGQAFCTAGSLQPSRPATLLSAGGHPREARIAFLGSGFGVVWSDGAAATDTDLFARAVGANGVAASNVKRLTQLTGRSDRPRIARGAAGLGLVWRDDRAGRDEALGVILPPSLDPPAGLPAVFQSPVTAADQSPQPAIAGYGTGFVVAFNGRGPDTHDHVYLQALDSTGAVASPPLQVVADLSDRATAPTVAAAGGLVAIADAESRPTTIHPPDVWAYVAGTAGVASATLAQGSQGIRPEMVSDGTSLALVWCDDRLGTPTLFFALVGAGGGVGERRLVTGNAEACEASITAASGFFLVSWSEVAGSTRTVRMQAFQPNGLPDGAPLTIATDSAVTGEEDAFDARPDVSWDGSTAGVAWVSPGAAPQVWFRPVSCNVGPQPSPTP
jgi:hypothetical protein